MKISKNILLIAYFYFSAISGEIVESESAADVCGPCECEGDDPQINHCEEPQGFRNCNVFKNQTCPDMFCDDVKRCFSVMACPNDQVVCDQIVCDDCECMDKQSPVCLDDPLGQCNKCQKSHPLSICRVPVDSKCVDKFCIEDDRCYAVTACDCESTPTASPTVATPTASPTTACPETDIDFYDNSIRQIDDIDDWQTCAKKCSESGCSFWTWITPDWKDPAYRNACFFKKSDEGRRPKDGHISGAVSCQGTTTSDGTTA